jgi:hypothetical protein
MLRNNITEFVDVNKGEKRILLLWNDFVRDRGVAGFVHLPQVCRDFIKTKGDVIIRENLYRNCLLHFSSIEQNGLIDNNVHLELVEILQKIIVYHNKAILSYECRDDLENDSKCEASMTNITIASAKLDDPTPAKELVVSSNSCGLIDDPTPDEKIDISG